MSLESAKAFTERVKTDEDFNRKVSECKSQEARMAFVKSEGFDFTPEDIEIANAEISDEELAGISGGDGGADWVACTLLGPRFK